MERNATPDRALVHTHVPRAVRDELRQVAQVNHRTLARQASGLPERRYRPHHTVLVEESAMHAIHMEVGSGLEAGGVLIGERTVDGTFLITDASGPAAGSPRTSNAIRHDLRYYGRFASS